MLSNRMGLVLATALAPMLWGTTYFTSTAFLIGGHPLLTATVRALPAGIILLIVARRRPRGEWWWKAAVLGTLNIGAFFAFLFIAADRLPGGVAAVIGAIQPLLVAVLASRFLSERLTGVVIVAGGAGLFGVALIVLQAPSALDPLGVAAAAAGAVSMAVGVVLTKRWAGGPSALALTSWQLIAGGLLLALLTAIIEPLPAQAPSLINLAGYAYLAVAGTAVAYLLWFRGIARLPTRVPAFLGLLSPLVALSIGAVAAGESLTLAQSAGVVLVLASVLGVVAGSRRPANVTPGS
ncbi:EamA family transporter [Microbacterium sp. P04]|uniref:EamA family transporter n=1 Tax=Microbacterium sp. P04 TaxID=3366947 RepID=UPI0037463688